MHPLKQIIDEQLENNLADQPIMEPVDFQTAVQESSAPHHFATSRSRTPAVYQSMRHVGEISATALRVMGCTPEDTLLNLLAPPPHLSGVAAINGAKIVGASVSNDHFEDMSAILAAGQDEEVSILASIPSIARQKADEINEAHGDPTAIFPNLSRAFLGGEPVRPEHRRTTKTNWGVESVHEFYGSSEASLIAVGHDESRRLVPLLNHLIIELYDGENIIDIREIETEQTGEILLTDPAREAITLRRYRQGDRIRVYPDKELPRIEPLGRADDAIDFDGALLHPTDLFNAMESANLPVNRTIGYVEDTEYPTTLTLYSATSGEFDEERLTESLVAANPALVNVIEDDSRARIAVQGVETVDEIPIMLPDESLDETLIFASQVDR